MKIRDERAQKKLLDEAQKNAQSLSFNRAVNLVKNMEATKKQKHQMVNKTDCINAIENKKDMKNHVCEKCGLKHYIRNKCPAYGKKCSKCNRINHFAKICKSKNVVKLIDFEEEIADQSCE